MIQQYEHIRITFHEVIIVVMILSSLTEEKM